MMPSAAPPADETIVAMPNMPRESFAVPEDVGAVRRPEGPATRLCAGVSGRRLQLKGGGADGVVQVGSALFPPEIDEKECQPHDISDRACRPPW